MLKQLQALLDGTGLLQQLQEVRDELEGLRLEVRQLTQAITAGVDRLAPPPPPPPPPEDPAVEVSYVDPQFQQEYAEIEQRLTWATGQTPTEDEIMAQWEREKDERDARAGAEGRKAQ